MPSTKIVIHTEDAAPPLPVYSQAVISRGFVYVSGVVGRVTQTQLVEGGVTEQAHNALENIKQVLKASGSGIEHVVKVNVYLANLPRDFDTMNKVYIQYFDDKSQLPARTCIGVAALPLGAAVEFECIAEVPNA